MLGRICIAALLFMACANALNIHHQRRTTLDCAAQHGSCLPRSSCKGTIKSGLCGAGSNYCCISAAATPAHPTTPATPATPAAPATPAPAAPVIPSGAGYTISDAGRQQMGALLAYAKTHNAGPKAFNGHCYHYVWAYLMGMTGGYGSLSKAHQPPTSYSGTASSLGLNYARYFADYFNVPAHAAAYGLQKLPITNPYDAPPGAIVVVGPGTPGTSHPKAGDITVSSDEKMPPRGSYYYSGCTNCHFFINDGRQMQYHSPKALFPHLLGIFAPL